jgi:hypothetical protein
MALFAFIPVMEQDGVEQDGFEARLRDGHAK